MNISVEDIPFPVRRALMDPAIDKLTLAEIGVLGELRKGMGDKEIASRLNCSIRVVRFHKMNAAKKLFKKPVTRVTLAVWSANNLWPFVWLDEFLKRTGPVTNDR